MWFTFSSPNAAAGSQKGIRNIAYNEDCRLSLGSVGGRHGRVTQLVVVSRCLLGVEQMW